MTDMAPRNAPQKEHQPAQAPGLAGEPHEPLPRLPRQELEQAVVVGLAGHQQRGAVRGGAREAEVPLAGGVLEAVRRPVRHRPAEGGVGPTPARLKARPEAV